MPDQLRASAGSPKSPIDYPTRVTTATLSAIGTGRRGDLDGQKVWAALGGAGLINELYPATADEPRHRGRPATERLGALLTALDGHLPTGPVLSVCVQAATAIPVLNEPPATPLSSRVRENCLRGRSVVALAATDSVGSGSSLSGIATTVQIGPSELVLDGGKRWVASACFADHALVLARHRPGGHFTSFTWVLVPTDAAGVHMTPAETDLFTGSGIGHLTFNNVRLTPEHLVGGVGRAMSSFTRHITTERFAGAMWAMSITRRVLATTRDRLRRTSTPAGPLWRNESIRHRYGQCLLAHEQLVALCQTATGRLYERQGPVTGLLLKAAAAQSIDTVLTGCGQLCGADGFTTGGIQSLRAETAMFGLAGGALELMLAGLTDHTDHLLSRSEQLFGQAADLGVPADPAGARSR